MFNPKNRDILGLKKETTIPILNKAPSNKDGKNGDLILVNTGGLLYLYCKVQNVWYRDEFGRTSNISPSSNQVATGYSYDTGWKELDIIKLNIILILV